MKFLLVADASSSSPPALKVVPLTKHAKGKDGAAMVSCGARHSAFVTKGGEVWCWGHGGEGELGQGNLHDSWVPVPVLRYVRTVFLLFFTMLASATMTWLWMFTL